MNPPFFVSEIMNLLVFFILSRKSISTPVWGGGERVLMQFMHFSAIFAMMAALATSAEGGGGNAVRIFLHFPIFFRIFRAGPLV